MTGRQLALALGPFVGYNVKQRLARLMQGAMSIALRYDEVKDWSVIEKLIERVDEVHFFDGEEWFLIGLEDMQ